MKEGWIKTHRKLLDNPRFKDGDWLKVWVWMLLSASHKPHGVIFKGSQVTLQAGQFTAGRFQISEITGVKENKVRRVIKWLENDQQISQQTSNVCTLFTITNWISYQESSQQNDQQPANEQPTGDQQPATKQEGKECKKGKKRSTNAHNIDDEQWLAELQAQELYAGLQVKSELQKMKNWCGVRGYTPSRMRLLNWLNKADKPIASSSNGGRTYTDTELTLIGMGKM